jgi:hypothetical protein
MNNLFEHMAYYLLLETRKDFKEEKERLLNEIKINDPKISGQTIYDFIENNKVVNGNSLLGNYINILGKYITMVDGANLVDLIDELEFSKRKEILNIFKKLVDKKLQEIKINNPNLTSPLEIKSQEHWDRVWPILKGKGYKWASDEELKSNNFDNSYYPVFVFISKSMFSTKDKKFLMIMRNEDSASKLPKQIFEYSEKTINTTIERWKKENPKVDDNLAKQVIQRFDQIKSGLAQKLNIVVLPDELKKGNNYLNIDKYSFDDMVKLIKSLPENPDKIKKDAIQKFHDKEEIDKALAQSYVARFMAKRDALKQGFENGLEDEGFTKEEVKKYIPKFLQQNNAFLDPRNWKWHDFETMLDALFPTQKTVGDEDSNEASTDADKVYDKNGIEIYKGDDVHKCISYNPTLPSKRKKYGWCVTQPGNTNYDYYRFQDRAPTFYIVFDRNKTSEPEYAPFKDNWHAFVIQVNADGSSYVVTGADNRGDNEAKTWEGISKIVPAETWSRIKDLKDYFKPIKLSAVERGRKFASGKSLSLEEFKDLDQDEKILYIQGKASKNQISPEIKKILPEYKINLEGRSTTLANVAIDSGQKFSWDELKNNEPLAKRYAIFRFRHTNYSKDPLPLPFVKYLDDAGKEKYLKIFDENLNFNLIEKFFGEKAASDYVNQEAEKLQYIPENAVKYLKDDKLKKLYTIYLKLTESWNFSDNFNLSEKNIDTLTDMPVQDVTPVPINQEQWGKLSPAERKYVIDLATKVNKSDKYSTLLYALPYVVKDGDKSYVLLPKSNKDFNYDKWVLADINGKVIKDNISGDSNLGNNLLITGYPLDNESINRIYSIDDLKGQKLKEIKINKPIPNHLNKLLDLQSKIKSTKDPKEKQQYAIQCAELVLPIWNHYYPNDDRPKKAIEAAAAADDDAAAAVAAVAATAAAAAYADAYADAAYAAADAADAASDAAYAVAIAAIAIDAANNAILATKTFFKLDEIKINNPILTPEEVYQFIRDKRIADQDPQQYSLVLEKYGFWKFVYLNRKNNIPKILPFLESLSQTELRAFKKDIENITKNVDEIKVNNPNNRFSLDFIKNNFDEIYNIVKGEDYLEYEKGDTLEFRYDDYEEDDEIIPIVVVTRDEDDCTALIFFDAKDYIDDSEFEGPITDIKEGVYKGVKFKYWSSGC